MLARKLGRSLSPPRQTSEEPAAPATNQEAIRERVAEDLRRRYQERAITCSPRAGPALREGGGARARAEEPGIGGQRAAHRRRASRPTIRRSSSASRRCSTRLPPSSPTTTSSRPPTKSAAAATRKQRVPTSARCAENPLPELYERAAFCILQSPRGPEARRRTREEGRCHGSERRRCSCDTRRGSTWAQG